MYSAGHATICKPEHQMAFLLFVSTADLPRTVIMVIHIVGVQKPLIYSIWITALSPKVKSEVF